MIDRRPTHCPLSSRLGRNHFGRHRRISSARLVDLPRQSIVGLSVAVVFIWLMISANILSVRPLNTFSFFTYTFDHPLVPAQECETVVSHLRTQWSYFVVIDTRYSRDCDLATCCFAESTVNYRPRPHNCHRGNRLLTLKKTTRWENRSACRRFGILITRYTTYTLRRCWFAKPNIPREMCRKNWSHYIITA